MSGSRLAIVLSYDSEAGGALEKGLRLGSLEASQPRHSERRLLWYDSPDFQLAAQGCALAVMQGKAPPRAAAIQALSSAFGDYRRDERLLPAGQGPEIDGVKGALAVFAEERLSLRRFLLGKGEEGSKLEIAKGWIDCKGASHPVCRVLLEGPRTALAQLMRLARMLADAAPCDLHLLENEAALGLAQSISGKSRKARKLGLDGIATVEGAFGQIVRLGIAQIAGNHAAVFSQDTVEGVHQMRVGVRRLRSAINLFRPYLDADQALRAAGELKELAQMLGPIRDGDVFRETILDPPSRLLGGDAGMERLTEALDQERAAQLSQARAALDKRRFTAMMLDLLEWSLTGLSDSDAHLHDFARKALGKRHRKLAKAGTSFTQLDPLQRHALRIRGKKMRYAGEFLCSLFLEDKAGDYLEKLSNLVDVLGHLNDIAVARRALDARKGEGIDASMLHAIGFVEGWHAGRGVQLEQDAVAAWDAFRACPKFWK